MNCILLTIDALGVNHMGAFGYERDTTPALAQLFEDAAVFPKTVAQSSHTRESFPAILSGEYPFARENSYDISKRKLISEYFHKRGMATAAFHSNPFLSRAYGYDVGFDKFYDGFKSSRNRLGVFIERAINYFKTDPYTRAQRLNQKALSWIDSVDGGFFCWIHYMDPHGPYQPPKSLQEEICGKTYQKRKLRKVWRKAANNPKAVTQNERQLLVDMHDADIRYLDRHIGELFENLKDRGLYEESIIALTADHGQTFGEKGLYTQPRHLFESLVNVPSAYWAPTMKTGNYSNQVRNLDVLPTLLDSFDIELDESVHGESVRSIIRRGNSGRLGISEVRDEHDAEMRFSIKSADGQQKLKAAITGEGIEWGRLERLGEHDENTETGEIEEILRESLIHHINEIVHNQIGQGDITTIETSVEERLDALGYR